MNEETTITLREDKDILLEHRNSFRKQYIDNLLDYSRHLAIREADPKYQRQAQNGKFVGIDELLENYRKGALNAKSYVDTIDGLLAKVESGEFDTTADNELGKVPVPNFDDEEGKSDE